MRLRYRQIGNHHWAVLRPGDTDTWATLAQVWPCDEEPWWSVEIRHGYIPFTSKRKAIAWLREEARISLSESVHPS